MHISVFRRTVTTLKTMEYLLTLWWIRSINRSDEYVSECPANNF